MKVDQLAQMIREVDVLAEMRQWVANKNSAQPVTIQRWIAALSGDGEAVAVYQFECDGKVAVLFSPGFGGGWSTWSGDEFKDWAMFSPELVAWVEGGKQGYIDEIVASAIGEDNYFYTGGARDLEIKWLPVGTQFRVEEYDGNESIVTSQDNHWSIA